MFFTPEFSNAIIQAFDKIAGRSATCPLCHNQQFTVGDGFALIELYGSYPTFLMGGKTDKGIPCAALVCTKCGNTFLINLITLGFGKDLEEWQIQLFNRY